MWGHNLTTSANAIITLFSHVKSEGKEGNDVIL